MTKGNNTRSGLLWEVERLLDESQALCKLGLGYLPDVLLMENVPQVIGKKNIDDFKKWITKLESLGYSNFVKVINAKDHEIPQNRQRCFMVSILGDYYYEFPKNKPLKKKLKDLLETNVDEKYFLSDAKIESISNWKAQQKPLENMIDDNKKVCQTLTARGAGEEHSGMVLVKEKTGGVAIRNATKKGYLIANYGDGIDISSRMETHRGTVQKDMSQTLKTQIDIGVLVKNE